MMLHSLHNPLTACVGIYLVLCKKEGGFVSFALLKFHSNLTPKDERCVIISVCLLLKFLLKIWIKIVIQNNANKLIQSTVAI